MADFGGSEHPPPDPIRAVDRVAQATDYLRRALTQISQVTVLSATPDGVIVFLSPAPATEVVAALAGAGAHVAAEGTWEATVRVAVGWWHRRSQLRALADAVHSFLDAQAIASVEGDDFTSIPDDLPRRRLGTIASPMEAS